MFLSQCVRYECLIVITSLYIPLTLYPFSQIKLYPDSYSYSINDSKAIFDSLRLDPRSKATNNEFHRCVQNDKSLYTIPTGTSLITTPGTAYFAF